MPLTWYLAKRFYKADPWVDDPSAPSEGLECPGTGDPVAAYHAAGASRIHAYDDVTGTCLVGLMPQCESAAPDWTLLTLAQAQAEFHRVYAVDPTSREVY